MTFLWIFFGFLVVTAIVTVIEIKNAWEEPEEPHQANEDIKELDAMIQETETKYLLCFLSIPLFAVFPCDVVIEEISTLPDGLVSAIGNADIARVLDVPCNRIRVKLKPGDVAYVAQVTGGRLPVGAKKLPSGFGFRYYKVTVNQ